MKKEIDAFDYAGYICKAMKKGILVTTKSGEKLNTMTIGWGKIGIEWGRNIFCIYVRKSRHTAKMLEDLGEFTVNIPYGDTDVSKILGYCGTKSGRDVDKFAELDLHPEVPLNISVPGIKELPLTLECKVIYKQKQDLSAIPKPLLDRYYPEVLDNIPLGSKRDYHLAYFGEIVSAYMITE